MEKNKYRIVIPDRDLSTSEVTGTKIESMRNENNDIQGVAVFDEKECVALVVGPCYVSKRS